MIPGLGRPIASVADIEVLKADPANKGRTFEVTKDVLDHFAGRLRGTPISVDELRELNELLGSEVGAGQRPSLTRTCACASCDHEFSFTDFVRSALALSVHTREQIHDFIAGPRCYLTIDTDGTRTLQCPACNRTFEGVFCCYATSDYAYV